MQDTEWTSLMARINGMSNQFTKTDWKIVHYIKMQPDNFISLSAQEIAKAAETSDASIIRFTQKVGYSGLNEFKYVLQQELSRPEFASQQEGDNSLLQDNKVLLEMLYSTLNEEKLNILCKRMIKSDLLYILGLDMNRHIAEILAHKFSLSGIIVKTITNDSNLLISRKLSKAKDLFLVISLSGEQDGIAEALGDFVNNGSYVVLLSNHEKSLCAAYADMLILVPKTDMLKNSNIITPEISLLQLGDIVLQNILRLDETSFKTFQKMADCIF